MNPILTKLLVRYQAPARDDGTDTAGSGAAVDVSDDDYMALPAEERSRLRGDLETTGANGATQQASKAPDDGGQGAAESSASSVSDVEEAGKSGNGIPRARMNEVVRQREAAQAEAAELRRENERLRAAQGGAAPAAPAAAAASTAQAFDVQAAEEQFIQALMDGDVKAAAALRGKINAHIEDAAFSRFTEATSNQQAATKAASTVDELLQTYPWLDEPEGAEALELIEASVTQKMSRGTPHHQALAEATNAIAPRFVPDGHPSKGLPAKGGAIDTRTERADQRGAADSLLQPAAVQAGMGNRATPAKVDATRLTDDEYMALPEAERKRLRGD